MDARKGEEACKCHLMSKAFRIKTTLDYMLFYSEK